MKQFPFSRYFGIIIEKNEHLRVKNDKSFEKNRTRISYYFS